jgi:hypothetical protein
MSSIANSIKEMQSMVSETNGDKRRFTTIDWNKTIHSDTLFSDGDVCLSSIRAPNTACAVLPTVSCSI